MYTLDFLRISGTKWADVQGLIRGTPGRGGGGETGDEAPDSSVEKSEARESHAVA